MTTVAALSLLWAATSVDAAPGSKAAAAKSTSAVADLQSASTAAFTLSSTAPLTLEGVLSHYRSFDRNLSSLSARFSQTMTVPETGMSTAVEGSIDYLKPDRLRIEYSRPERQTVVADGDDIWVHRHSQSQVLQMKLSDWKAADPMANNLMQFGSYGKMLDSYRVALDTSTGGPVLALSPQDRAAGDFDLRLELDRETLFPRGTELIVGSLRIRSSLAQIRFNPALKETLFHFVPPPGTDVFRDFKPPRFGP